MERSIYDFPETIYIYPYDSDISLEAVTRDKNGNIVFRNVTDPHEAKTTQILRYEVGCLLYSKDTFYIKFPKSWSDRFPNIEFVRMYDESYDDYKKRAYEYLETLAQKAITIYNEEDPIGMALPFWLNSRKTFYSAVYTPRMVWTEYETPGRKINIRNYNSATLEISGVDYGSVTLDGWCDHINSLLSSVTVKKTEYKLEDNEIMGIFICGTDLYYLGISVDGETNIRVIGKCECVLLSTEGERQPFIKMRYSKDMKNIKLRGYAILKKFNNMQSRLAIHRIIPVENFQNELLQFLLDFADILAEESNYSIFGPSNNSKKIIEAINENPESWAFTNVPILPYKEAEVCLDSCK